MAVLKPLLQRVVTSAGYELRRENPKPESKFTSGTHLAALQSDLSRIPGMITPNRCSTHYLMAYAQSIEGDIVEIGSWQGRNTCFLAAACRDSRNGIVHAIDHFKGNPGKEHHYVVGASDLSDLEVQFRQNVEQAGLSDWVELHAADAREVQIEGPLRMLFIDGEHTREAVLRDLERYAPLVSDAGLIVFDDYSVRFPEVVEGVNDWIATQSTAVPVQLEDSLVVRV